ncbi:MAG: hypothetical protein FWB96_00330 [Defluviitaleaceae bacterium]|nr:hypothetical protein [Defluviitaleaceae bacterium]MCL2261842.1 hypothetical protein [Defluviitaleaceae bacterium]
MILYYSREKKTKVFATALGEVLGREVYELESDLNDKGSFGFMIKALGLAFTGKSYPVTNMPQNLPEEIFLCSPIWGGQVVGPAKYFLENADLKNTTVNLLVTASVPVEKYKNNALEELNKIPCTPGRAFIFATSDKIPPELDVIKEQLRELL